MPITNPNPFATPNTPKPAQKSWTLGRIVARALSLTFLVASLLPSVYIAAILYTHYIGLSQNPTVSYRPLVFVIALPISAFTAVALAIVAAVFRDFGDEQDVEILSLAIFISLLPVPLGFFGPLLICLLTGASLGS